MAMSRKNYREMVKELGDLYRAGNFEPDQIMDVAVMLAGFFKRDNAAFDKMRFLHAVETEIPDMISEDGDDDGEDDDVEDDG